MERGLPGAAGNGMRPPRFARRNQLDSAQKAFRVHCDLPRAQSRGGSPFSYLRRPRYEGREMERALIGRDPPKNRIELLYWLQMTSRNVDPSKNRIELLLAANDVTKCRPVKEPYRAVIGCK